VPICLKCSAADTIREILTQEVFRTTAKKVESFKNFEALMLHFPSHLPHPDGVQRIKNASNELANARIEMAQAYARLSDYLDHGIVPEDLKRSGPV
jgi:hypothetical protein